jgi:hypothetical protein
MKVERPLGSGLSKSGRNKIFVFLFFTGWIYPFSVGDPVPDPLELFHKKTDFPVFPFKKEDPEFQIHIRNY